MTAITGVRRPRNLEYEDIIMEEPEPDMSQVDQEMPSMDEYRRWEEAFTAHLGFTSPEFNFKLMRFIGASRNMIDELTPMLTNPNTRERWDGFTKAKEQKDHVLILRALTATASGVKPGTRNEPIFRHKKKSTRKTRNKRRTQKKKVKRRQRWTAHKST